VADLEARGVAIWAQTQALAEIPALVLDALRANASTVQA
jgi:hypothetical protein